MSEGNHTIRFDALDIAGNLTRREHQFILDTIAPVAEAKLELDSGPKVDDGYTNNPIIVGRLTDATGGISEANAADFLALSNVLCVGGTWMLDSALIAAKNWSEIEIRARAAARL